VLRTALLKVRSAFSCWPTCRCLILSTHRFSSEFAATHMWFLLSFFFCCAIGVLASSLHVCLISVLILLYSIRFPGLGACAGLWSCDRSQVSVRCRSWSVQRSLTAPSLGFVLPIKVFEEMLIKPCQPLV
jgi:hypothetical protein